MCNSVRCWTCPRDQSRCRPLTGALLTRPPVSGRAICTDLRPTPLAGSPPPPLLRWYWSWPSSVPPKALSDAVWCRVKRRPSSSGRQWTFRGNTEQSGMTGRTGWLLYDCDGITNTTSRSHSTRNPTLLYVAKFPAMLIAYQLSYTVRAKSHAICRESY